MIRWHGAVTILLAVLLTSGVAPRPAVAVDPGESLSDPTLETRARALGRGIRCLVCQNQSIDDSNAELAKDLRIIVRERLVAGDSDAEILEFLVARYGDFVLLKPPVKPRTYLLWYGPAAFLAIGSGLAVLFFRRRRAVKPPPPLTSEETAQLAALMRNDGEPRL